MKNYERFKEGNAFDAFFLLNPFYRGMAEIIILIGTGIYGLFISRTTLSVYPLSNIVGGTLILFGIIFHCWAEKDHKAAHKQYKDIDMIVTTGIYSKIRHPLYLSIIIMNVGIALAFGVTLTLIIALMTIIHWTITSYKEEAVLLKRFPDEYVQYVQEVRWRMIPRVF